MTIPPPPPPQRTLAGIGFTDGGAGMASQVQGLLAAVGASAEIRQAPLVAPWKWLWPGLIPSREFIFADASRLQMDLPPDIVVSSGRQSIMASLVLKRRYGARLFTVHTQDPRIDQRNFDLIACPAHDGLTGPRVVGTFGAIHHITAELLAEHAARGPIGGLQTLNRPFVLVLLGGPTRNYPFTVQALHAFEERLDALVQSSGRALAILPSRRTPPEWVDRFVARFGRDHYVWPRQGENPYLAGLALATHCVVTCDSVNMISEAAATGRPVYVEMLPEARTSKRFHRFYESFQAAGITRPFNGMLAEWTYTPPNATQQIADEIKRRMRR